MWLWLTILQIRNASNTSMFCNVQWTTTTLKTQHRVRVEESGSKKYSRNGAYLRRTYQTTFMSGYLRIAWIS
uniref:Secreted protein n=1 Tax=Arundo donax TaxID=35708 RepID=A0A0A9GKM0_ARUDO